MGANKYVGSKTVVLECRHKVEFNYAPPAIGEKIWCARCTIYRVITSIVDQLRVRCLRCNFSHAYGRDWDRAYKAASKHVSNYPSHSVKVWDGAKHLRTVTYYGDELPLSEARKELPKDHHAQLRSLGNSGA